MTEQIEERRTGGYDTSEVRTRRAPEGVFDRLEQRSGGGNSTTSDSDITIKEARRLLTFLEAAPASAANAKRLETVRNRIAGRK